MPSFKARNESLDLFDIGLRNGCGIPAIHGNTSRAAGKQQRHNNEESRHNLTKIRRTMADLPATVSR